MRKPMVTRTILSTKVTVLGLDIETAEPLNATYNLSGVYGKNVVNDDGEKVFIPDDKKLLKAVQKEYESDEFKIVHVVSSEIVNTLYGMDENEFLAHAKELDPVTRKPLLEDSEDE